jgi:signal transduction histidine kinase/putative methionine-R-sulfoxide reductase with GAF domain
MTRATEELPFLNEVCNIIINYCGYKMVWVGYAEDNEEKTVTPVAYSGFEEGYLEKLNVTWADNERGNGPTGTTIKTGELTICKNMLTDPAFEPWRKDAIERGYASSIVFPLISGSKTFGAITIYSRETDSFTEEEIDLLSELADDLSYGIVSIRSRIAQKEAEDALRKSEKNYHRLFEYSAIPIWKEDYSEIKKHIDELKEDGVTDFRTYFETHRDEVNHLASHIQVLDINQKSLELFNAESKDDVIRNMLFYFNEESLDVFCEELIVLAEGGRQFECEMPIRTLSGDIKIIDLHLSVVKGFENTLSNVLVSYIDITDRKKMDNELKRKNIQLTETNATKDKFFKIIAHDMKNPFISLLGASELLYENAHKYDGAKIAKLTKILNDSAKSGYDMLLNLLEWSRSQAGSMMYQPEKINLKEQIHRNHSNLIEHACGKKIRLSFEIENDLHVYADKNMLDTILRNLITNALKFTKKGGEVTVSTKRENGSIIVLVKDTGVGIKEDDFDKLFRTDIKYSQPGTEHEGGTGLGLLLCKEFVEKHGGNIWVESVANKGTTFYFSLKNSEN